MHALLLCDETDENAILALVLQRVGLTFTLADNPEKALRNWSQEPADLVVLALHGGVLADQIRAVRHQTETPLVVIANTHDEDILSRAFEAGADWIVTRPYSTRLLIPQLRAVLRRGKGVPLLSLPHLTVGGLMLDPGTRTVTVDDRPSRRLTHLEFRLLYTLMIHRGQTLPTSTLIERVWGYEGEGNTELVRGLISRLRAKIEVDARAPKYIVTVPGVGYFFLNPQS